MLKQKAKKIIASAFGEVLTARDGINVSVSCPECDATKKKKKLSIRLDDHRYHCWVCGSKGKNVWKYIARKFPNVHIDPEFLKNIKRKTQVEEDVVEELTLPKGIVPVFRASRDPDVKSVRNYLLKRGLSMRDIARWRVMTTTSGRFRRRAIIPSFDSEGNLNYYVGRSIDENAFKYMNANTPKREVVFNEVDIDWKKPIVLVEGVFDAMKSISNTVPLLGSTLPEDSVLFRKLMRNTSSVIVSLDPDLKHKAYKISESLMSAGCDVRICFPPAGVDMGDRDLVTNSKMLASAKRVTPYSRLTHKIKEIKSGSIL